MCVCRCTCVCVHVYMHVHVSRGQKRMSDVFCHFLLIPLRQNLSLKLVLVSLSVRLEASQPHSPVSIHIRPTGVTGVCGNTHAVTWVLGFG